MIYFIVASEATVGILHEDAVFHHRAGRHAHAAEEDGVLDGAFDVAAVGDEAVFHARLLAVIGAHVGALFRADRAVSREEIAARAGLEHGHAGAVIVGNGVDALQEALVLKQVDLAAVGQIGREAVRMEVEAVGRLAAVQKLQQHVLADDIDLRGGSALACPT